MFPVHHQNYSIFDYILHVVGEWEQAVYRKDKKKKAATPDDDIISDKTGTLYEIEIYIL